jgi:FkbM family methyltransferase
MKVVQIGTNNGSDDVNQFCKSVKPSLILLVEPFDIHIEEIKRNYNSLNNVIIESIAIHYDKNIREAEFFYTELDGPVRGPTCSFQVSSLLPEHLIKHGYKPNSLKAIQVPCLTLNELFIKYNLSEIDYLFIDIEGVDLEVLKSIDFNKFKIHNIQIEHLHLDKSDLFSFMKQRGYIIGKTISKSEYDTMFTLVD